jgi:hypothetical protein
VSPWNHPTRSFTQPHANQLKPRILRYQPPCCSTQSGLGQQGDGTKQWRVRALSSLFAKQIPDASSQTDPISPTQPMKGEPSSEERAFRSFVAPRTFSLSFPATKSSLLVRSWCEMFLILRFLGCSRFMTPESSILHAGS